MDTSETYIKMCEKAEEIQSLVSHKGTREVKWNEGDMIALEVGKGNYKVFMYSGCDHSEGFIEPEIYSSYCIWLPRQDQLQEMIEGHFIEKLRAVFISIRDYHLTQRHYNEKEFPFDSMEQLWLAFVMKEKYGKIWNGEDWVNITN